ncbi:MAG: hypothetical protein ACI8ZB_002992 [Desulforhopalus sp.]|jgi:hypothetical protein
MKLNPVKLARDKEMRKTGNRYTSVQDAFTQQKLNTDQLSERLFTLYFN